MRQPLQPPRHAVDYAGLLAGRLGVALGLGLAFLLGGEAGGRGLGLQPGPLLGVLLEGQHRAGHAADLVTTADGGDDDVEVAAGQARHDPGHGLDRPAQGADQPQGGADGDGQGQQAADGERDIGLKEGGLLGLGARFGPSGLLVLDGGHGGAHVQQAQARPRLDQGRVLGGGVARQRHDPVRPSLEGVDGRRQRLLLGRIGAADVRRRQIDQARPQIPAALRVPLGELGFLRRRIGAQRVLLLDGRRQQAIRRLEDVPRGHVRRVRPLQRGDAPQDDQGRHAARADHRGEGGDQLLGNRKILQHGVEQLGRRSDFLTSRDGFAKR
ncbi:hypothetical protein D3C73_574950 [compost metagenome]